MERSESSLQEAIIALKKTLIKHAFSFLVCNSISSTLAHAAAGMLMIFIQVFFSCSGTLPRSYYFFRKPGSFRWSLFATADGKISFLLQAGGFSPFKLQLVSDLQWINMEMS